MLSGKDANQQGPEPVGRSAGADLRPITIIADDLTGACDAAAPFAILSGGVRVHLSAAPSNITEPIWAISTESRDLPPSEADHRIRHISQSLPESTEVFKKIDSVFRGNTPIEIGASLRHFPFDVAVISPAHPALGRTVINGKLLIDNAGDKQTLPILDLLAGHRPHYLPAGLSIDVIASQLDRHLHQAHPVILCDATEQSDLVNLVHAAKSLQKRVLWIGSGGLAHAIASTLPASQTPLLPSPRSGPAVFFIGSPHAVTAVQVDHLKRAVGISEFSTLSVPNPTADLLLPIHNKTSDAEIRNALRHLAPQSVGCLFMTGGETASRLCRILGIETLLLTHELAPGIPAGIAEGGLFDGVPVILKSGGFGSPDLLHRISQTFASKPKEVHA